MVNFSRLQKDKMCLLGIKQRYFSQPILIYSNNIKALRSGGFLIDNFSTLAKYIEKRLERHVQDNYQLKLLNGGSKVKMELGTRNYGRQEYLSRLQGVVLARRRPQVQVLQRSHDDNPSFPMKDWNFLLPCFDFLNWTEGV